MMEIRTIEELKKYPPDALVNRQMTAEWGVINIEQLRYDEVNKVVTID